MLDTPCWLCQLESNWRWWDYHSHVLFNLSSLDEHLTWLSNRMFWACDWGWIPPSLVGGDRRIRRQSRDGEMIIFLEEKTQSLHSQIGILLVGGGGGGWKGCCGARSGHVKYKTFTVTKNHTRVVMTVGRGGYQHIVVLYFFDICVAIITEIQIKQKRSSSWAIC